MVAEFRNGLPCGRSRRSLHHTMSINDFFLSVLLIAGLMVLGKWIRQRIGILRKMFLPSSIVAGAMALMLGPQVLGRFFEASSNWSNGLWSDSVLEVWSGLPGVLISVVFAALFLGKPLPGIKTIWKKAGPMVAHGQTMAWGQYVVGISLALFVIIPIWDTSPLVGALIEIGFEGGHGTAAGLGDTFRELGFADGADMALGLATIGVVAGVLLGTLAINWMVLRGHIPPPDRTEEEDEALAEHDCRETPEPHPISDQSIEPLSIHIGLVAFGIGLGWVVLEGLIQLEARLLMPLGWPELIRHVPLFPMAMIGGTVMMFAWLAFGLWKFRRQWNR